MLCTKVNWKLNKNISSLNNTSNSINFKKNIKNKGRESNLEKEPVKPDMSIVESTKNLESNE
jgi:hypothetical protein